MTIDKREAILARLFELLSVTGIENTYRNRPDKGDKTRPCAILMDGDESSRTSHRDGRGSLVMAPQIMQMQPQIFVLLKEARLNNENSAGVNVGTELNTFRTTLLGAIASDSALRSLIGANGGIALASAITDLKSGSDMSGQMLLSFQINYLLIPT